MADVNVTVGTNTTAFNRGLDQAKSKAQAFGVGIKQIGTMIAGAFSINLIRQFMSEMDKIGKMATSFGISAEALQRVKAAADIAGTSIEAVGQAMFRLNGEVATGGPMAEKALEGLGMRASEFLALPMDQQLAAIAGEMDKLPSMAEKIALGYDLFGRRAREVMPLLLQGQQSLQDEFDRTATVSDKTVRQIEELNDELTRIGNTLKSWTGGLLGGINELSQAAGGAIYVIGKMFTATSTAFEAVKCGDFKSAANSFSEEWSKALEDVGVAKWQLDKELEQAAERTPTLTPEAAAALDAMEEGRGKKDEFDLQKELDKLAEETARKRLSIEGQIFELRRKQEELTETDPREALAAAKEIAALEEQARKLAESQEEQREKGIISLRSQLESARFDALTREEKVARLMQEVEEIRGANLETEEQRLAAELRLLEIQKEISGEKQSGGDRLSVVASTLQRVGGGGNAVVSGRDPSERILKVNQDQLARLDQIRDGIRELGGVS
jgi:hypothetical protein